MSEANLEKLQTPLLILRVTIGVFLLQWGVEKLVMPEYTQMIFKTFYFVEGLGLPLAYGMGVLQTALAIAIIVGFKTNISYLIGFVIHGLSTLSTIGRLIDPYGPGNHLFMTAVPVLAGMWLLYVMRDADVKLSVDAMRKTASD